MGLQVALNHRTEYRYDKAVKLGPQVIRLRPAPHCRTPILSYSLNLTPADHTLNWQLDVHHNHVARAFFQNKTTEFAVDVDLVADPSTLSISFWNLESKSIRSSTRRIWPGISSPIARLSRLDLCCRLFSTRFPEVSAERSAFWSI
jgi:transglutaminase-like putative cysteine protease